MKNKYELSIKKDGNPLYIEEYEKIECTKNIAEINELISIFNTKITFLKSIITLSVQEESVLEEVEESVLEEAEESVSKEGERYLVSRSQMIINALKFKCGLLSASLDLGDKFRGDSATSNETLRFESKRNIYYGDVLVVEKRGNIPYFAQGDIGFKDGIAKVVLDLRTVGVYGSDFDATMLNDGQGNFGKDFDINIIPKFEVEVRV